MLFSQSVVSILSFLCLHLKDFHLWFSLHSILRLTFEKRVNQEIDLNGTLAVCLESRYA